MTHFEKFIYLLDKNSVRYELVDDTIFMPSKANMRTYIEENDKGCLCLKRKTQRGTKIVNPNLTAESAFLIVDPSDANTKEFSTANRAEGYFAPTNYITPEDQCAEKMTEYEKRTIVKNKQKFQSIFGTWYCATEWTDLN